MELRFNQDSDFTCMKRLLQKGADVNAKDSYDYTPIMYAAKGTSSKALDAVKYLVKKGAQLNAKNYYDSTAVELAGKTCSESDTFNYEPTFQLHNCQFSKSVISQNGRFSLEVFSQIVGQIWPRSDKSFKYALEKMGNGSRE